MIAHHALDKDVSWLTMSPLCAALIYLAQQGTGQIVLWAVLVAVGVIVLILFVVATRYISLWLEATFAGVQVGMVDFVMMRFRKVDARQVIKSQIRATKAGLTTSLRDMEMHYLAGGRLPLVVDAMIIAHQGGVNLPWMVACAADLAGRDVVDLAHQATRVLELPVPAKDSGMRDLKAVAQDGVEVRVRATVHARLVPERVIGGATEASVVARAGVAIIRYIGELPRHTDALQNPQAIADAALAQDITSGSAFEVLDVQVTKVDADRPAWT